MYPHERSLVQNLPAEKFAIVGVNSDPDLTLLRSRIADEQITWRSFWCGRAGGWGRIPSQWGVRSWPKVYLLDHAGVIRGEDLHGAALDQAIAKLIAERDAAKR
jgi:hypothetical protein